ncbi:MAG: extracellular solute-binding protein [Ruminococcus sp.]
MQKRCNNCFHEYEDAYEICPHCGYAEGGSAKELFYLQPGMKLADRYIVGMGIGHGGFGITYLAWDTKFEITVAIKEYYPSGIVNRVPGTSDVILFAGKRKKQYEFGFTRFIEEAQNMAQFSSHPNIVNVYEYFEENNTAYIVMEYLDGICLDDFLKEHSGKLPVAETVHLVEMICHALKDIHKKGIIHRDIAPDNIMVSPDGNIKLFDFGAARFSLDEDRKMTVVVKPGFAPVEQYNKVNTQGPWTDIYALGAMMYMMLTGIKPDESTNRAIEDTVQPPHMLDQEIPEYLRNVVMKAMAMNPVLRFQAIGDMEKALLQQKKVRSPEVDQKRRKRRRFVTIAGCGIVVCIAASVLGVRFWNQYLPAASITVCYQKTGVTTLDAAKQDAMESVAEQFQEFYPQITVEVIGKDTAELQEMLEQRSENDAVPTLFESTDLPEELCADCVALTGNLDGDTLAECYFSAEIQAYAAEEKKIPLGFRMPVLFVNQSLCEAAFPEDGTSLLSVSGQEMQLQNSSESYSIPDALVRSADSAAFSRLFPDAVLTETTDASAFLERQTAYYFSDSADYLPIIFSIPGQSVAIPVDAEAAPDGIPCQFDFTWSISGGSSAEKKAAEQLLSYMLSEEGQETLMVQNQSSTMPLHQTALEHYCSVYQEIFSSVPEEIADGKLCMEE